MHTEKPIYIYIYIYICQLSPTHTPYKDISYNDPTAPSVGQYHEISWYANTYSKHDQTMHASNLYLFRLSKILLGNFSWMELLKENITHIAYMPVTDTLNIVSNIGYPYSIKYYNWPMLHHIQ